MYGVNLHFLWVSKTCLTRSDKLVAKVDDLSYTYVDKERAAVTKTTVLAQNFFTFIENYSGITPKAVL